MQINQLQFAQVVEAAKAKAANNPRWIAAIDKAVAGILSGELIVTTLHDGALVTTENGSYLANGRCSCKAFQYGHKECKHRAAARLWERYEEETANQAVSRTPAVIDLETASASAADRSTLIASIKSTWSTRYPADNLSDNLMARFKQNSLDYLSIDFLQAIRATL